MKHQWLWCHRVTLVGCVVCSHVHVEDRASLKDCLVGANFTVVREGEAGGRSVYRNRSSYIYMILYL